MAFTTRNEDEYKSIMGKRSSKSRSEWKSFPKQHYGATAIIGQKDESCIKRPSDFEKTE